MIVSLYDKPLLDLLRIIAQLFAFVKSFFIAALYVLDYTSVALACNIGVTIT
nr:MAG TPA: hypothetical protein [Caudoviricetes sp.]